MINRSLGSGSTPPVWHRRRCQPGRCRRLVRHSSRAIGVNSGVRVPVGRVFEPSRRPDRLDPPPAGRASSTSTRPRPARRRGGRALPGAGDPAGVEGRVDLPAAQRSPAGRRHRRRRAASVPLPRAVAAAARPVQARPGAGRWPRGSQRATPVRRASGCPACRTSGPGTAFRLLDLGFFRIGGEAYAEANNSYGLATIERGTSRPATEVVFEYAAKSGGSATSRWPTSSSGPRSDAPPARWRKPELLAYRDGRRWRDITRPTSTPT